MSQTSTHGRMLATRLRQLPLNPPLSYTPQKWRQPEDTISKNSDSISLGEDVIFIFANLPDSGPANPFTLKRKSQEPPAPPGGEGIVEMVIY